MGEPDVEQRKVYLMHACENGEAHVFGEEVFRLVVQCTGVQAFFWYRDPLLHDAKQPWPYQRDLISNEQLQQYLPLDDYEFLVPLPY